MNSRSSTSANYVGFVDKMDLQETLGLEDLSLEQIKPRCNYAERRSIRAKGRQADQAKAPQDLPDKARRLDGLRQESWGPLAPPVFLPPSLPPLERSANVSHHPRCDDSVSSQAVSEASRSRAGKDSLAPHDLLSGSRHLSKPDFRLIYMPGAKQTAHPAIPFAYPLPQSYDRTTRGSVTRKPSLSVLIYPRTSTTTY